MAEFTADEVKELYTALRLKGSIEKDDWVNKAKKLSEEAVG